jgi:Ca-activated chloride channel family protein
MKKFLLLAGLVCSLSAMAQVKNGYPGQKTRMLFLLDGSGSMLTEMGNSNRWAVAVTLMNKMVDTLRTVENLEVGLRVFGHTQPNEKKDCNDTKLEVPFAPFNHKQFAARLKLIKP